MNQKELLPQVLIAGMEAKFFARSTPTVQTAEGIISTAKQWAEELGITHELRFGYIERVKGRYDVLVLSRHKGAVERLTAAGAVWME